eukprot:4036926-Amphidinium_carterae.1
MTKKDLNRPLPENVRNIRTVLYYRTTDKSDIEDKVEKSRKELVELDIPAEPPPDKKVKLKAELQLKEWQEQGKDVDIIYDPRPKDPSFPPKPSGAESSGSGGTTAAIEVVENHVTMPIAEVTRNIIEFCCDDDSSLGKPCPKGCKVMRVTKGMDATKSTTVEKAMSAI